MLHVSIFPMAGDALLQAIKTVFGEAVADEVMLAYGFLAEVLIAREKEFYAAF